MSSMFFHKNSKIRMHSNESNHIDQPISLVVYQTIGKSRLPFKLIINRIDLRRFTISHKSSKIHIRKVQISHVIRDSLKEISPHNV